MGGLAKGLSTQLQKMFQLYVKNVWEIVFWEFKPWTTMVFDMYHEIFLGSFMVQYCFYNAYVFVTFCVYLYWHNTIATRMQLFRYSGIYLLMLWTDNKL